jgi:hypothetical protein
MSGALPDFIVIGAMKAGTTSLHRYLGSHPDVVMSDPKELNFFVAERTWARGLDWYREHFRPASGQIAGEASPDYTKADVFQGVPRRIAQVVPDARLVYLVRHPIERMRSMYLHELVAGRERAPAGDALLEKAHYVNTSRYAWQLDHFREFFPRDQVLVVVSEQLRDHREATLRRILGFLGARTSDLPVDVGLEHGVTAEPRIPTALGRRIAGRGRLSTLARRSPVGVRAVGGRLARRRIDPSRAHLAALAPHRLAELRDRLAPDVARLRADYLGTDFDGWGIA